MGATWVCNAPALLPDFVSFVFSHELGRHRRFHDHHFRLVVTAGRCGWG
jgi:hypothetical protein